MIETAKTPNVEKTMQTEKNRYDNQKGNEGICEQ